jgi:integrase
MKFGQAFIDNLELPTKGDRLLWDSGFPNFGLRLTRGQKSYILQYRNEGGQSRRMTIGRADVLTLTEAKKKAREILVRISHGDDPAAERDTKRTIPTFAEFWDTMAKPAFARRVKASTLTWYGDVVDKHLRPVFGSVKIDAIKRPAIVQLHAKISTKTPYAANRAVAALRAILNHAVECGVIETNPALRIKKNREHGRERVLSGDEMRRLLETLDKAQTEGRHNPALFDAIRMLVWSGLRLREVCDMRWEWIDAERRAVRFPEAASKGGKKTVALNALAWEIIERRDTMRGPNTAFVFESGRGGAGVYVQGLWMREIRVKAELPGLRLHDLRHNAGTWSAICNLSGPMIKSLLGHADLATTDKYLHLSGDIDPVRAASELVANTMMQAIEAAREANRKVQELPVRLPDQEEAKAAVSR